MKLTAEQDARAARMIEQAMQDPELPAFVATEIRSQAAQIDKELFLRDCYELENRHPRMPLSGTRRRSRKLFIQYLFAQLVWLCIIAAIIGLWMFALQAGQK